MPWAIGASFARGGPPRAIRISTRSACTPKRSLGRWSSPADAMTMRPGGTPAPMSCCMTASARASPSARLPGTVPTTLVWPTRTTLVASSGTFQCTPPTVVAERLAAHRPHWTRRRTRRTGPSPRRKRPASCRRARRSCRSRSLRGPAAKKKSTSPTRPSSGPRAAGAQGGAPHILPTRSR